MEKEYIFLDTETTGLSEEKERMTEIAMVRTDENFNIIETFQMMMNPERELSDFIKNLTGITEEMLENEPKYDEAIPQIMEWYSKNSDNKHVIGVAHNMPFDRKFINKAGQDILGKDIVIDWIDTVSLAREMFPFFRNHKLDTLAKKFGIVNENHHRAMNDTMVLYYIGKKLIPEFMEDGLNPINFRTTKKLHYGK